VTSVQSISYAITNLLYSIASLLIVLTIMVFLLKVSIPALGEPLWRNYGKMLAWLIMLPFRILKQLIQIAAGHRRS